MTDFNPNNQNASNPYFWYHTDRSPLIRSSLLNETILFKILLLKSLGLKMKKDLFISIPINPYNRKDKIM